MMPGWEAAQWQQQLQQGLLPVTKKSSMLLRTTGGQPCSATRVRSALASNSGTTQKKAQLWKKCTNVEKPRRSQLLWPAVSSASGHSG